MAVGCRCIAWYTFSRLLPPSQTKKALAKHTDIRNTDVLRDIPFSMLIGYWVPTILMSMPLSNNQLHQCFGGAWQRHPIWIILVQQLLSVLRTSLIKPVGVSKQGPSHSLHASKILNRTYLLAFGTAAVIHTASLAIMGTRTWSSIPFSQSTQDTIIFKNTYQPLSF